MLIYFKIANYKSIKDPIELNFNASSISEHTHSNVIEEEAMPLLKSIVMYGPNASGKSKILDAFEFFRWFIINSAIETQRNESINVEPFLLSKETIDKPSFFEASFIIGEIKYRYGFEASKDQVHKEWLLESKATKEYPVFLRINEDFQIEKKRFPNADGLEKRTRKNALFLSVASQWNVKKAEQVNEWFANIYSIHGLADEAYKEHTIDLLKTDAFADLINRFVQKVDLGIQNVEYAGISLGEFKKDREEIDVFAVHNSFNAKGEIEGQVAFDLYEKESEGTKKYFNLIGVFISAILESRLVIMDEFDARFHTLLSKSILKLFNSSEIISKSQLLVASHDTALLDRDLLRRDQIYFVEKNGFGATEITSLVEYKPRKESPYDKNYLDGKYGAIPFINDLASLMSHG